MNDTNERPAEFDRRLMSYMAGIRGLAIRWVEPGQRADVIQDTLACVLANWQNYRHDGDYKNFWAWLRWQMRGVISKRKRMKPEPIVNDPSGIILLSQSTPANQEEAADLAITVEKLRNILHGDTLLRHAAGETFDEIAAFEGISRQGATLRCEGVIKQLQGHKRKRGPYVRRKSS